MSGDKNMYRAFTELVEIFIVLLLNQYSGQKELLRNSLLVKKKRSLMIGEERENF
jgi:hypothetical protein